MTIQVEPFDLDTFYSAETIDEWKAIIGEELHYHFGYFQGKEDLASGLRQTVRNFYPHIPEGSRVLDVGCGWGGPALMLINERHCTVQGVAISTRQVGYCQRLGLDVWQCDVEQADLSGSYDIAFMLEAISHIRDKAKVLAKLRKLAPRIILSESCMADNVGGPRTVFGSSIALCTVTELKTALEQAGWKIQFMRNRRFQSIPTLVHWKSNLEQVYGERTPPGQLGVLHNLTTTAFRALGAWCQAFPLIDIVAE